RVFAREQAARTGAAIHRLRRIGKVRGRLVILLAAPLTVAEQESPVRRAEQSDQLSFQHDAACILDGGSVWRLGIRVSFINLHVLSQFGRLLPARIPFRSKASQTRRECLLARQNGRTSCESR